MNDDKTKQLGDSLKPVVIGGASTILNGVKAHAIAQVAAKEAKEVTKLKEQKEELAMNSKVRSMLPLIMSNVVLQEKLPQKEINTYLCARVENNQKCKYRKRCNGSNRRCKKFIERKI